MTEINPSTELFAGLRNINQRVTRWFTEIPAEKFFTRQGEIWSASDNVDHLIRSHKPIIKALKLPKFTLQAMFGKPEGRSKTYEEICEVYRAEIAKGAQASGRFLPEQSLVENAEEKKAQLLLQWSKVSTELVETAGKWNDSDLDGYLLPHPLIGKITIREMLFFTIYHNLRHANQEGD